MDYTVTLELEDGTIIPFKFFDQDRNEQFIFKIVVGQVIEEFEEGVLGMCVGEKRRLLFPSELVNDDGEIIPEGAGATLFFDIELHGIEDGPAPVNVI